MTEPYDPLSYGMLPKSGSSVEPTEESHAAEDILFGDEPPPSAPSENVEGLMAAADEGGDWDPVEDNAFGGGAASLTAGASVSDLDLADAGIETGAVPADPVSPDAAPMDPMPVEAAFASHEVPPAPAPEEHVPPEPAAAAPAPAPAPQASAPAPGPRDPSIAPAPRMHMEPAPRRLPTRRADVEAPSSGDSGGVEAGFQVQKRRTGLALGVAGGVAVAATAFAASQVAAGSLAVAVFAGLVGGIGAALAWVSLR